MKKFIALVAAALIAAPAFALGLGNDNPSANSTNLNNNTQGQNQGQAQGQLQGQAQFTNVDVSNRITNDVRNNAAAFAGAASKSSSNSASFASGGDSKSFSAGGDSKAFSGGNSLTVNEAPIPANTSVQYGGEYTVKGVPNVLTGNVYPTAPCMGSSTIGGSGVGFGFGIGTSWKDDDCGIRETARSFAGMNKPDDAIAILCTSTYSAAAPSCKALAPKPEGEPK